MCSGTDVVRVRTSGGRRGRADFLHGSSREGSCSSHGVRWDLMSERSSGAVVDPKSARNLRPAALATAVLAVATLLWLRWSVAAGNWADLDVYVRGAHAILTRTSLYEGHAGVLPFTYPPFPAVAFTPLDVVGPTGARWVFTLGSLVSYL